jgi:hypothetical protein
MKRWFMLAMFALLGFVYPFLMTAVYSHVIALSPDVAAHVGADNEAGVLLMIDVFLGGGLFLLLWTWIGSVLIADPKRGVAVLTSSVVLGTAAFLLIGRVIQVDLPGSNVFLVVTSLLTWFVASALAGYAAYRLTQLHAGSAGA